MTVIMAILKWYVIGLSGLLTILIALSLCVALLGVNRALR
jgi:hypothetical protein